MSSNWTSLSLMHSQKSRSGCFSTYFALPRHGQRFTLNKDACDYRVRCINLQQQPNEDKLRVRYWSRNLSEPEKNYSTAEKELVFVVWSILTLRPYLYKFHSKLRTDQALNWILNVADSSERLACWRVRLAEYDCKVEYRPGSPHKVAAGVSRLQRSDEEQDMIDKEVPCSVTEGSPNRRRTSVRTP